MTISLQLNEELGQRLQIAAQQNGVSESELISQCLEKYLSDQESHPSAWELGKNLFGRFGSGQPDMARQRKRIIKEKLRAQADHG